MSDHSPPHSPPRRSDTGPAPDGPDERTVDVRAVKSALARLAAGDDRPDPEESPGAVVDEAVAATARLDDAAAFVAADGRERLATAVDRLAATDRSVTADRGAAVLADFAALRDAASGESRSTVDDRRTTSAPPTERL